MTRWKCHVTSAHRSGLSVGLTKKPKASRLKQVLASLDRAVDELYNAFLKSTITSVRRCLQIMLVDRAGY